jgi:hypothetical protein
MCKSRPRSLKSYCCHRVIFLALTALIYTASGCAQNSEKSTVNTPELAAVAPSQGTQFIASGPEPTVDAETGPSLNRENPTILTHNSSISEGDTYGIVVLKGRDTTLRMSGGSIAELIIKDTSRVSVDAGIITEMYIYDNCEALISGGKIRTVSGYGKHTITLRGKAEIEKLQSYGASKIIIDSMDTRVDSIQYFTRCGCVDQSQKVKLELVGGYFGSIGTGATEVALNIAGYNLSKSAYGGKFGYGVVKGRWKDGTVFFIDLADKSTFSQTDLYEL